LTAREQRAAIAWFRYWRHRNPEDLFEISQVMGEILAEGLELEPEPQPEPLLLELGAACGVRGG